MPESGQEGRWGQGGKGGDTKCINVPPQTLLRRGGGQRLQPGAWWGSSHLLARDPTQEWALPETARWEGPAKGRGGKGREEVSREHCDGQRSRLSFLSLCPVWLPQLSLAVRRVPAGALEPGK